MEESGKVNEIKTGKFSEIYKSETINADDEAKLIAETKEYFNGFLLRSIDESKKKGNAAGDDGVKLIGRFDKVCKVFIPEFAKADILAMKYQKVYQWGTKLIYILAALSVLVISSQFLTEHPLEIPGWKMLVEIISMLTIVGIIKYGNHIGWHKRWINYRLLAEHFRFAVFIAMVGERVSTKTALKNVNIYKLKDEDSLFSYFRNVRASWEKQATPVTDSGSFAILKDFVLDAWLEDQHKYHTKNKNKYEEDHERLSFIGESLFALTIVAAILHYFHIGGHHFGQYLTFAAVAFPVTGSALAALRAIFEYNKLARRSEEMTHELDELKMRLNNAKDMESLIQICEEALNLMLNEVSSWHVLIGFHKPEAPA